MLYQIKDGTVSAGGQTILSHVDFYIKEKEKLEKEKEELQESVNSLKAKNLELLAMIPVVSDDSRKNESETSEEIKIEDIYY